MNFLTSEPPTIYGGIDIDREMKDRFI